MKYIKKIIIDNFQSHKHSEIDFEADLNILVGESDKGKSAVLRALKWILYNEPRGTDFIRYGTNECSVTIIMGDGYSITRSRKKTKNIYSITTPDGQVLEFENFGNLVPDEVIQATGIKKLKLDTDVESALNFNEQLDPPFLLSETGTIRAKAIGRIVNTNIIDAAERDIQKDIQNNNLSLKNYEKQLEEIEQELKQYENILQEEQNIEKIDSLVENLTKINDNLIKMKEFKTKISQINQNIELNLNLTNKLNNLPNLSEKYSVLKEKYFIFEHVKLSKDKINSIHLQIQKDNNTINNLSNILKVDQKNDNLNEKFKLLQALKKYNAKILEINSSISSNKNELSKVENISSIENSITSLKSKIEIKNKILDLSQKLNEVVSNINKGNIYMKELNTKLKNNIVSYSKSLKHLGKCPTCYSAISESVISQILNQLEGDCNDN